MEYYQQDLPAPPLDVKMDVGNEELLCISKLLKVDSDDAMQEGENRKRPWEKLGAG